MYVIRKITIFGRCTTIYGLMRLENMITLRTRPEPDSETKIATTASKKVVTPTVNVLHSFPRPRQSAGRPVYSGMGRESEQPLVRIIHLAWIQSPLVVTIS
jgi:hypothetical protein